MSNNPLISIVIPVYNVEPYIEQYLDSVLKQTFGAFEVLCVDDCGTDASMRIIETYAAKDERIRILRNPGNLGPGDARNTGLFAARGDYVTFHDPDDWILPDLLEKAYAAIVEHNVESVCFNFLQCAEDGDLRTAKKSKFHKTGLYDIDFTGKFIPQIFVWNKLYNRRFILENKIFFPSRLHCEDIAFTFNFFVMAKRTFLLNEPLYVYRKRQNSITDDIVVGKGRYADICRVCEVCCDFLRERGCLQENMGNFLGYFPKQMEIFVFSQLYKDKMIPLVQAMLDNIGYPEKFAASKGETGKAFFDAIRKYEKNGKNAFLHEVLYCLNKFNPIPTSRRKWRAVLNVYRAR